MDDAVRQTLKRLVEQKGKDIMLDARRCEGLLRDYCPSSKREVAALVRSLKRECPQRLINAGLVGRSAASITNQMRLIAQGDEVSDSEGSWAVEAWGLALRLPVTPPVKSPPEQKDTTAQKVEPKITTTQKIDGIRVAFLVASIICMLLFMASPSVVRACAAILFFLAACTNIWSDVRAGFSAFMRGFQDGGRK
jgi:hypothetical protein